MSIERRQQRFTRAHEVIQAFLQLSADLSSTEKRTRRLFSRGARCAESGARWIRAAVRVTTDLNSGRGQSLTPKCAGCQEVYTM